MVYYKLWDVENQEYHENGKLYTKEHAHRELQIILFYAFDPDTDEHGHESIDQCTLEEILAGAHYQLHYQYSKG
jgi:hypothetical protein